MPRCVAAGGAALSAAATFLMPRKPKPRRSRRQQPLDREVREVLRLECGSLGVAVELSGADEARGHYAIVPLATPGAPDTEFKSAHWPTVMKRLQAIPKSGPAQQVEQTRAGSATAPVRATAPGGLGRGGKAASPEETEHEGANSERASRSRFNGKPGVCLRTVPMDLKTSTKP
jgi:hypothetical protein